jgi:hypothetical protein
MQTLATCVGDLKRLLSNVNLSPSSTVWRKQAASDFPSDTWIEVRPRRDQCSRRP